MKIDRAGFYSRVQEAMKETSAPAIGKRLGVTKQAVYAWEKRGVIPEADVLGKIVEIRGDGFGHERAELPRYHGNT